MYLKQTGNIRLIVPIQCDRCKAQYENSPQSEANRFTRFGINMCDQCFITLHSDLKRQHTDRVLPDFLGGSRLEKRMQKCDMCNSEWLQDTNNAKKYYWLHGNLSLCKGCKSDVNHICTDMVTVTCSVTGKQYQVTKATFQKTPCGPWVSHTASMTGRSLSEVTKSKISHANKGRKLTEEAKQKISERSKQPDIIEHLREYAAKRKRGEIAHPFSGKHHSEESKVKLSFKNTGQIRSAEIRQRMSESRKAYFAKIGTYSDETKHKISKTITRLRAEGFKPESAHLQETYMPVKPCFPEFEKATPYTLSSSWESHFARWLDLLADDVTCWTYEPFSIFLPDGRPYLVDFIFQLASGETFVVEVKPKRKIERNVDRAAEKWEALQLYCKTKDWQALLITEDELREVALVFGQVLTE